MIKRRYHIICDNCGGESTTFCDDKKNIGEMLDNMIGSEEWRIIGKKHICPNCYRYNDETDNYELLPEDL